MPQFVEKAAICVIVTVIALGLASARAEAQATRTWVSGVGDDVNPCSRTAPCKTFAGAISKTQAGGEISVLDPGGFGAVTITKSITIDGGSGVASILAAGTNGIVVNGANVVANVRNLTISGAGTGLTGVWFINGASLTLQNVVIENFTQSAVRFAPSATADLLIDRAMLRKSGYGVLAQPGIGAFANVVVANSTMENNINQGLRAEDRSVVTVRDSGFHGNGNAGFAAVSTGANVSASISRSTASHNGAGFAARVPGGAGTVFMLVDQSNVSNNLGDGVYGLGPATIHLASSRIWGNGGTGVNPTLGATILSRGDNVNLRNAVAGAPSGVFGVQ
jgi:hypothetical protein